MAKPKPRPLVATAPRLMRAADAAKYLGISERSLFTMRERGEIVPKRIGGTVRYDRHDLDGLADGLEHDHKPPKAAA